MGHFSVEISRLPGSALSGNQHMAAFEKVIASEAGAAAMKYDGVRPQTLAVYLAD